MKRLSVMFLTAAVAVSLAACKSSQEHPSEHPTKEHPEHPSGKIFDLKKEYTAAVTSHIDREIAESGAFKVFDRKIKKDRGLTLVRIHSEKIVGLGTDRYFACADFKEAATGKIVDLDFYAVKESNGWKIDPALIHKVEGVRRFTYDAENNRIPVRS